MRVLFIPYPDGIPSHGLPLLALRRSCDQPIQGAFLLPRKYHHLGPLAGVDVLDHDFTGELATELDAYRHYRPDVVIDDCNPATYYACAATRIPRVTVLRIAAFPGYTARNPHQAHTLPIADRVSRWVSAAVPAPAIGELCSAGGHVIPAIAAIEPPTAPMIGNPRYAYAGPLNLPDDDTMRLMAGPARAAEQDAELQRFLDLHAHRPLAFMTFGIAQGFREEGRACVRRLIESGFAVISTFSAGELDRAARPLHFWSGLVPLDLVCGRADVVIHQCGSGTYYYPLLHGTPTITLATGFVDREDIALRLEDLGVSVHVRESADPGVLAKAIVTAAHAWLEQAALSRYRAHVRPLQREIGDVSASFRIHDLLELAVARGRQSGAAIH